MTRDEEEEGKEGMCDVFGENELVFTAVEWASSRWIKSKGYLVELIAEVYWVDVVTLEIGEHYDLWGEWNELSVWSPRNPMKSGAGNVRRRPW